MKKVWKGAAAAISAAAIAATGFIGATSAYAADTYQISIENNVAGYTYAAYQVFAGDLDVQTNESGEVTKKTLSNITFGRGIAADKQAELLTYYGVTDAKTLAEQLAAGTLKHGNTSETAEGFAKKVADTYLSSPTGTTSTKTDANTYVISNLPAGYYLVKNTEVPSGTTTTPSGAYTPYILQVLGDVTTKHKTDVPSVKKEVYDNADGTTAAGWGTTADHKIGEEFQFKLEATIPADVNIDKYDSYKVQFVDTMSSGVTFKRIDSVQIGDVAVTQGDADNNYQTTATENQEGGNWTLTINDIKTVPNVVLTGNIKITVLYTAVLNENAQVLGNGNDQLITNDNKVDLKFTNDIDATGEGDAPGNKVYVASYKINNTKYANSVADDNKLSGAKFKLTTTNNKDADGIKFTKQTDGDNVGTYIVDANGSAEIVSGDDGSFNLGGLDYGTYYLFETQAPNGFNLMNPNPIVITVTPNHYIATEGTNQGQGEADVTGSNLTNNVINTSGSNLPETGGMGTTMLYVAGGAIVLIAGIGMAVALRRRQA